MALKTYNPHVTTEEQKTLYTSMLRRFGFESADKHFVCGGDFALLGGKGFGLYEMARDGLPIPPGFTITTEICTAYRKQPKTTVKKLLPQVRRGYRAMREHLGYSPLVSVRSGARVSMPGMMDTVLNVGLTSKTMPFWTKRLGAHAALDCRRRLVQMYGSVVNGINSEKFETILSNYRHEEGVETDAELGVTALEGVVVEFEDLYSILTGKHFPDTVWAQLEGAIVAVFKSWNNARAIEYRRINEIPGSWGTAVNIQTMVFGNMNYKSGSGVLFTRNPSTGENVIVGEYLPNAQGEEVVAGTRTPLPIEEMANQWPEITKELVDLVNQMEEQRREMQDIEFTVEDGKLWILQTRNGKRSAQAAFVIACDMVEEGWLTKEEALRRLTKKQFQSVCRPVIDPSFNEEPTMVGTPACPGLVSGRVALTANMAVTMAKSGPVILVRPETTPDDIHGMHAAVGILTMTGGLTSHAAVVARSMDTACIVGCSDMPEIEEGTEITIDGLSGNVWVGFTVPVINGSTSQQVQTIIDWSFDKAGAMRESSTIQSGRQRVFAAEWSVLQREKELQKLRDLPDASGIVIDLRQPKAFRREEDMDLWNVFGEEPTDTLEGSKMVVADLTASPVNGVVIELDAELQHLEHGLRDVGYRVVKDVCTVSDLLHSDGIIRVTDDFVEKIIGGAQALKELTEVLKKAGKPIEVAAASMTIEAAVAAAVGG